MTTADAAEQLIELVYRAAEDPDIWDAFLERLDAAIPTSYMVMFLGEIDPVDMTRSRMVWNKVRGITHEKLHALAAHAPDPFMQRRHLSPRDGVVEGQMLLPYDEYYQTDYYRSVGAEVGFDQMLAQVLRETPDSFGSLSLIRRRTDAAFSDDDVALMRRIGPHVRRAALIAARFARYEEDRAVWQAGAEALPFGLVLVSSAGTAAFVNPVARAALGDRPLQAMLAAGEPLAATVAAVLQSRRPSEVTIRSTHGEALCATVLPVEPGRGRFGRWPVSVGAAVLFRDPRRDLTLSARQLNEGWGLTAAESELALDLLAGRSLAQHAGRRGITTNTARAHLRSVKQKIGVSRTSDLVAHLALQAL